MVGDCNNPEITKFIEDNLDVVIERSKYDYPYNDRTFLYFTPMEEYIFGYVGFDEEEFEQDVDFKAKRRLQTVLNLLK